MRVEDFKTITVPENFGGFYGGDWSDEMMFVLKQLSCDSDEEGEAWSYGASKMVFFIDAETVVKLPFQGLIDDEYDQENGEFVFREFEAGNYCQIEEEIYDAAIDEGLDMFFAGTQFGGFTANGYPFYISERVKQCGGKTPSQNSLERADQMRMYSMGEFSRFWLAEAIEWYGEELVSRLIDFVNDQRINDLTSGNTGYRADGAPVLLDYSGFREDF